MYSKALLGIMTFALLFIIALGIVSLYPVSLVHAATPTPTPQSGDIDPFGFLIAVLTDAYENDVLPEELSDLLADWLIENVIAPETGETADRIARRLSQPDPFDFLMAVLTDARNKNALPRELSSLLSDLFIKNIIAPETGESPDQIARRLTEDLEPKAVQIELPAEWSGYTTHPSGARIEVPEYTTNQAATVRIEEVLPPDDSQLAGKVFDFSVGDAQLAQPVTLRIPYELKEGQDAANIVALRWNEETKAWEYIGGAADEQTRTIGVEVSELSDFSTADISAQSSDEAPVAEIVSCQASPSNAKPGQEFTIDVEIKNNRNIMNNRNGDIKVYMDFTYQLLGKKPSTLKGMTTSKLHMSKGNTAKLSYTMRSMYSGLKITECILIQQDANFWVDRERDRKDINMEIATGPVQEGIHSRPESIAKFDCSVEESDTNKYRFNLSVEYEGAKHGIYYVLYIRILNTSNGKVVLNKVNKEFITEDLLKSIIDKFIGDLIDDAIGDLINDDDFDYYSSPDIPRYWGLEKEIEDDGDYIASFLVLNNHPKKNIDSLSFDELAKLGIHYVTFDPNIESDDEEEVKVWPTEEKSKVTYEEPYKTMIGSDKIARGCAKPFSISEGKLVKGGGSGCPPICGETPTQPAPISPDSGKRPPAGPVSANIELLLSRPIYVEEDRQATIPVRVTNEGDDTHDFEVQIYSKRNGNSRTVGGPVTVELASDERRDLDFSFSGNSTGNFGLTLVVRRADTKDTLHEPYYDDMIKVVDKALRSDLELSVSASRVTADAGENITYTLDVTNHGPDRAKKVMVEVSLSQEALFHSDSRHARCSDPNKAVSTFTCSFSSVSVGETEPGGLTVTVPREATGSIVSAVSVYMDTRKITDPYPANNTAQVTTTLNSAPAPHSDRATLVALYNATDGSNWRNNANWLTDKPLREWYGVNTDASGRVIKLNLSINQLSGEIPPELGNLTNLVDLRLDYNQLSGPIPSELGNLNNLKSLELDRNQLSGGIPSELGNLNNLEWLYLHSNQLSGEIPSELGNLTSLEQLGLSENQLSGAIPSELGNLTNLEDLRLFNNQLSGAIPSELGNLTNLKYLALEKNQLSGAIPSELGNLNNLEVLWLWDNQLSGAIPSELGNLNNLGRLDLSGNQLSGPIPSELGNLNNLGRLDLSGNQLSGPIPSELGNLTNLEGLFLSGNQLSGAIPSELGNLTNLEWLLLHYNQLSGEIPSELGNLNNLEVLWLHYNQLSGSIPPELGNLTNLEQLGLGHNQLSGPIPPELGNLSNLESLHLGDNQLSGCIPDGLKNVQNNDLYRLGLPFCG